MSDPLQDFREQGYCVLRGADESFRAVVARARAVAERWAVEGDASRLNWKYEDGSFKHYMNPHQADASFRELMSSPTMAQLVRTLFGDRPMLVTHAKVSYKMQGKEQEWLPHQDGGYNPRPTVGATICIYLERCDQSNGTLQLVPGSHKLGILDHEQVKIGDEKNPQLRVAKMPDIPPLAIEGDAGDVLAFDRGTIHQSGHNSRGGYRCILIFEVESFTLSSLPFYSTWHMMFNRDRHRGLALVAPGVVRVSALIKRLVALMVSGAHLLKAYGRSALRRVGLVRG